MEKREKPWMNIQRVLLKGFTGHKNLWLTDFPNYDHRKKRN